tara:strand:- start:12812 stop:12970 length:159 start_codon:yes stop_codon:yes gene_type:complete
MRLVLFLFFILVMIGCTKVADKAADPKADDGVEMPDNASETSAPGDVTADKG